MGRGKSSRAKLILLALLAVVAIHDFAVPRGHGLAARGAIFLIDEYRAHVSPRLRGKVFCRFEPTCSAYGRAAFTKDGFGVGAAKTAWRIARCGPWTPAGTRDLP
ncbi:MAG TPA: membrane protein insertion efficiency factor YidD [Thermoanaerobaculia bacterium]